MVWTEKGRSGFGDARDLVTELLCAEIYMLSSPSNLLALGSSVRRLLRKFGLPASNDTEEVVKQVVALDVISFSKFTTLATPRKFRRHPIVIVPALTPRTADYAVVGQAGYLASGLTTVFCNGVGPGKHGGRDQSCFIGTDSWDSDAQKISGMPHGGPYHGVFPGIYRQNEHERGWLGTKEQALVVADIDPIWSFGGNPRPQSLGSTLNLVAHLPIIESKVGLDASEHEHACWCGSTKDRSGLTEILSNIETRLTDMHGLTIDDNEPERLADLLTKLAHEVEGKSDGWLHERAQAYLEPVPEGEWSCRYWRRVRLDPLEARAISGGRGKSCLYDQFGQLLAGSGFRRGGRGVWTSKVKFTSVEQFPLDLFSRFQADRGGQSQGEAHVESGVLSARTNRLDPQRKGGWHFV